MQIAASLVRLSSWFEASTIGGSSNIPLICKAFNGALVAVVDLDVVFSPMCRRGLMSLNLREVEYPPICKAFNGARHAVVANFNQLELASTRRKAAAALIWSRKCQTYT
jgi:hypothetical protein